MYLELVKLQSASKFSKTFVSAQGNGVIDVSADNGVTNCLNVQWYVVEKARGVDDCITGTCFERRCRSPFTRTF